MYVFNEATVRGYKRSLAKFAGVYRQQRHQPLEVFQLEEIVNRKVARCEDTDTPLGERLALARDYLALNNSRIANKLGVSRELVRQWVTNIRKPPITRLPQLAVLLQVPATWLGDGSIRDLSANSHIGARVGKEALRWREALYGMTQSWLASAPIETLSKDELLVIVERHVRSDADFALVARRAGGRWQVDYDEAQLVFVPWRPRQRLSTINSTPKWSVFVRRVTQEELGRQKSVYAAWSALRERCLAAGLSENDFPRRITLHKRVAEQRKERRLYGVDWNQAIERLINKGEETDSD